MENQVATSAPLGPEREYFDALASGRIQIQRCRECAQGVFYPRCVCPHCGAAKLDWVEPSGRAVVYATTVVHRKTEQGGDYNVCLVDLEEGVRMMAQVVSVPPSQVRIGMPVRARIEGEGETARIVFDPREVQT
ncbi:Zn-ribbon domain-containing OB-fold protein [Bordetella tumulicola]|uniref:Zn-ribbon domain-containing OB-fold protein n=1 Tax=Bordetella tumulicola TaxID=1649133 RepID=UPI0039F11AAC